jgi:nitrogenase molybdenum-iron protein NifN
MIEELVDIPEPDARDAKRVNVLPGSHLTPGDIDELHETIEAFGLTPVFLPDLSGSLDGHIPDDFTPTTFGGCSAIEVHEMGRAAWTLVIGTQMRGAAITLEHRTGVPYRLFERLTGLACCDEFMEFLSRIGGVPVPRRYRRLRGQLVDAMLDGHFYFGGKRIAVAAEPDQLWAMTNWLHEMGCVIVGAVTSTMSPLLEDVPADEVILGDLADLEEKAACADLIVANSQARQAADRLHLPLFRIGIPIFDRLGAAHIVTVGYRATRDLIFAVGNMLMEESHESVPDTWRCDEYSATQTKPDFTILPS